MLYFFPSFLSSIFPKKNVDNSPAALSIVMALWIYYKSCTFIIQDKFEPTNIK